MRPVRALRNIPTFSLYGERRESSTDTDPLHIEDIPSRSRKYLWRIGMHRHQNLYQCVLVDMGEATVDLDGSRGSVQGPAAIIIPAGTVHGFRFSPETRGYVLTVDLDRLLALAAPPHHAPIHGLFSAPRIVDLQVDKPFAEHASQLLSAVLHEFRQPESINTPIGGWLAISVLSMMAHKTAMSLPSQASQDLDRLRRFRLSLESNLLKHWPAARYAGQLSISETSLNRLCRRLTGYTAFDLIQQRLALEARRRLLYIAGPVAALATELGFKDAAYFCRFFRRRNGMSPGEYRKSQGGG
jgi:AraC family transcriptional regulator, transcriptional activator of pobA